MHFKCRKTLTIIIIIQTFIELQMHLQAHNKGQTIKFIKKNPLKNVFVYNTNH